MRLGKTLQTVILGSLLAIAPGFAAAGAAGSQGTPATKTVDPVQVRQTLNKLAWYGVFDNLSYEINDNGNVTLSGEVRQYVVRNDAVSAIKRLPGVTSVTDKIEVLPLSPYDDRLRVSAFNAIYGFPALSRYVVQARPSIRIIVDHGDITLAGYVANEMDREMAFMRVKALPGTFKVTNDLKID